MSPLLNADGTSALITGDQLPKSVNERRHLAGIHYRRLLAGDKMSLFIWRRF